MVSLTHVNVLARDSGFYSLGNCSPVALWATGHIEPDSAGIIICIKIELTVPINGTVSLNR